MSDPVPFSPYAADTQPALDSPAYVGTRRRHPLQAPVKAPHTVTETSGPRFNPSLFPPTADLSRQNGHEALGERIIVEGTVTDGDGRPVPHTLPASPEALPSSVSTLCGASDHPRLVVHYL